MDCANFLEFFPFSKILQGSLIHLVVSMDSGLGLDSSGGFARQK